MVWNIGVRKNCWSVGCGYLFRTADGRWNIGLFIYQTRVDKPYIFRLIHPYTLYRAVIMMGHLLRHDRDTYYIGRGDRMVRSDCIGRPDRHYRAALPLALY